MSSLGDSRVVPAAARVKIIRFPRTRAGIALDVFMVSHEYRGQTVAARRWVNGNGLTPKGAIMKTIIGSAIGVLALGLILIGASLRGSGATSPAAFAPTSASMPGSPNMAPVVYNGAPAAGASGPVMVNCAPGQRALVRQVLVNGEAVSQVACVTDVAADGYPPMGVQARPVSYTTGADDYRATRSGNLTERRVVYQQPATERVVRKERSWKKPLLVIGGSTAAGAGIGGLVGGKKGALIGAALGGGASTLFEATRK